MFAILFEPEQEWNKITKAVVVGIATTALFLALVPLIFYVFGAAGDVDASPFAAFTNLINHLVFGLALAFVYKGTNASMS